MDIRHSKGSELVIDTNVLIDLIKEGTLEKFVVNFNPFLTKLSLFEYLRGELYIGHEIQKRKQTLEEIFTILQLDNKALRKACQLWAELAKNGELIPEPDIWIGALCITKDLPFLSDDIEHFKRLERKGLELIAWEEYLSTYTSS